MRISIITVNLNGNRFLAESIESVLGQDHPNFELVIIDGCSSDGSLVTIREAAARDNRVRWVSEPDRGIADAMNKGIAMATGDLIGFLHSDDQYPDSNVLSGVVSHFSLHPEAHWLTGGLDLINAAGEVFKRIPVRSYSFPRLVRSNILFHPATFVLKKAFYDYGFFNPELKLAMDYDLWLRLGSHGDPVSLHRSLASFRVHEGSQSIQGADEALTEEFSIRRRYLSGRKQSHWPYWLHHQAKRILNTFSIRALRRVSEQGKVVRA